MKPHILVERIQGINEETQELLNVKKVLNDLDGGVLEELVCWLADIHARITADTEESWFIDATEEMNQFFDAKIKNLEVEASGYLKRLDENA